MYLRTDGGQRILDAVGGAGTVVLGHGVRAITDAIARHGTEVSFCYGATFTNPWQEQLAEALVAMNSRVARRVYFVSGGSEGNETAVKMARQYDLQRTILMEGPDSIAAAGLGAAPRAGPVGGRDPAQHDRRLDRVPAHRHAGHRGVDRFHLGHVRPRPTRLVSRDHDPVRAGARP